MTRKSSEGRPALLAVVEEKWLKAAEAEFGTGRPIISFVANTNIGIRSGMAPIKHVYFKPHGVHIVAVADCLDITDVNPRDTRLPGYENETGKFYYSFGPLEWIKPIPLSSLIFFQHWKSGAKLPPRDSIGPRTS